MGTGFVVALVLVLLLLWLLVSLADQSEKRRAAEARVGELAEELARRQREDQAPPTPEEEAAEADEDAQWVGFSNAKEMEEYLDETGDAAKGAAPTVGSASTASDSTGPDKVPAPIASSGSAWESLWKTVGDHPAIAILIACVALVVLPQFTGWAIAVIGALSVLLVFVATLKDDSPPEG